MKFPLDFLPMALCGLATIVAVAVVLVASDLLRRFVLFLIARLDSRRSPPSQHGDGSSGPAAEPGSVPDTVSRSETLPG
jgi:hypothetical protein